MVSMPAETWNVAHGPCGSDGSCARGQCVRARACVAPGSPAAGGGLCSASRGPIGHGAQAALAMIGLAVLARRRRR